jgi:hypothetical protein
MKKHILTIIAALVAIKASAGTVTKNFDYLNKYSRINVSDSFKVTLVQGDEYKAVVTIDSALEEYLEVSVIGNVLYLRLKERDIKTNIRNIGKRKMEAIVSCPALSGIYLTGTASVTSPDKWVSPMERFTLEANSASKAEKLRIEGSELKVTLADAANAGISGNFGLIDATASGASVLFVTGEFGDVAAEAADASKISFIGTAETISATCTGTSFLDALELKVAEAAIECSVASKANLFVNEKLEVELKGASNCHYKSDNESLNVIPSVSRASSLKRIH